MANEELVARGYFSSGRFEGERFGAFEVFFIGGTSVTALKRVGVDITIPDSIDYPFSLYKAPKKPSAARPDRLYVRRTSEGLIPVAIGEDKAPTKLLEEKAVLRAAEQGLFAAAAIGANVAITSNGERFYYINVKASLLEQQIIYFDEKRDFGPAVLANILEGDAGVAKDPRPLAESIWQMIWQATKEEPKACLLTFVEIFVLKFLSDNLPLKTLPDRYRFYTLLDDRQKFQDTHGMTAIEYYVESIRPFIKSIFPDNTICHDRDIGKIFGLSTVVSKTSVINGFAFLRSASTTSLSAFDRIFRDILREFHKFGPLTTIEPEFKLRLYETFLRKSARQQKLGQFFTPRNVVRPIIKMARLNTLEEGAVVLDPAAGVGGFILEPPLVVPELFDNTKFKDGKPVRRIKLVGVDVDANTHILAKANTLLHYAEAVRDPAVSITGLNQLMAQTFVLMNGNETLGSLENPPIEKADIILTNPPYVTRGSGVYKDEFTEAGVNSQNIDLSDYYYRAGLGVEALFIRYISGALKPGGRAFVIVPLGLLNRTDPAPKKRILDECNLLASIALPRNTFFNTAQLTYILVLEKRSTKYDDRPPVFCGIARTIGESLNWERVPTPDENDLDELANMFVQHSENKPSEIASSQIAKICDASEFTENDRWDVSRFWTEEELVKLGLEEGAVTRAEFVDEVTNELSELITELGKVKQEIDALTAAPMKTVKLSDTASFEVRSGTRITGKQLRENPGELVVFSCFRTAKEEKGRVSKEFWQKYIKGHIEEKPVVTVNANGASVGKVYLRKDTCVITDDVIAVECKQDGINLDFLAVALRTAVDKGGFLYEAKLFVRRVRELEVEIPINGQGDFDLQQQVDIASAIRRFDALKTRLSDLGERSSTVRTV